MAIDDLAIGDSVLAYDEATGVTGSYTVTAVLAHLDPTIVHLTIDSEPIETTPEHPFFVENKGWTPAGYLMLGDQVRQADGSSGVVQGVVVERRSQPMYNLTVTIAHTFFVGAGEWLVHNTCKIDAVLAETGSGKGKITSQYTLTADEALEAGQKWLGPGYQEIGKPNSGVFRNGPRQFRMDGNSLAGNHPPKLPHVHFEEYAPGASKPFVNNHVPFTN